MTFPQKSVWTSPSIRATQPLVLLLTVTVLYGVATSQPAAGQPPSEANAAELRTDVNDPVSPHGRTATLKLAGGEIPLTDFIDYVGRRLNVPLLYDQSVRSLQVNLVAPDPIPVDSLDDILQSILLNEGLVITDPDQRGFRRIVPNESMSQVARTSPPTESLRRIASAVPLVRVFVLEQGQLDEISKIITPFLSPIGASAVPLPRQRILIVTDVAQNVRRVESLLELLTNRGIESETEFIAIRHLTAADLASQLREILLAQQKSAGRSEEVGGPEITVDPRTNSLILIGRTSDIASVKKLIDRLDQPLETERQTFTLRFYSPDRFDETIRGILAGREVPPPYRAQVEGNRLIVDSTPEVLELIGRTRTALDTREAPEAQNPVRFYKIRNVPADELLETIRGIGANVTASTRTLSLPRTRRTTNDIGLGPGGLPVGPAGGLGGLPRPGGFPNRNATATGLPVIGGVGGLNSVAGAARNGFGPDRFPLSAAAVANLNDPNQTLDVNIDNRNLTPGGLAGDAGLAGDGEFRPGFPDEIARDAAASAPPTVRDADVAVDVHTNTIIIVAPPEVQRIYASLIERLDVRRPQVVIEARVVIVDTSDNHTLGVEISGGDREGAGRLFAFSSYGLSTVDPVDGALQIIPGVGFNGTLVDPDTADVVVRALSNHRRARVLSTPRILVNDNAEGVLTSVLEVPFTSVNASETVATTSFGGFAEAGTTINVTPTISDDNYLQLDYAVALNSFTGAGADGIPPPRQTNEVRSRVTIPDGYTVIVGGLSQKNEAYEINSIPILENIPVIRELVSLQTEDWAETSLFVFLKPVILREDKFKDLRFVSDAALAEADLPTNFPQNEPILIE